MNNRSGKRMRTISAVVLGQLLERNKQEREEEDHDMDRADYRLDDWRASRISLSSLNVG